MGITATIDKIGLEDFYLGSGTFSRTASDGSTVTMTKINTSAAALTLLHSLTCSAADLNTLLGVEDASQGDLLIKGSSVLSQIASVATGKVMKSAGVNLPPSYGKYSLGDTGIYLYNATLDSSETFVVSSGFTPSLVILFAAVWTVEYEGINRYTMSIGADDCDSVRGCITYYKPYVAGTINDIYSDSLSINANYATDVFLGYTGYVSATTSDSYSISITKVATEPAVGQLLAIALP